jgi:hypothetical protein
MPKRVTVALKKKGYFFSIEVVELKVMIAFCFYKETAFFIIENTFFSSSSIMSCYINADLKKLIEIVSLRQPNIF